MKRKEIKSLYRFRKKKIALSGEFKRLSGSFDRESIQRLKEKHLDFEELFEDSNHILTEYYIDKFISHINQVVLPCYTEGNLCIGKFTKNLRNKNNHTCTYYVLIKYQIREKGDQYSIIVNDITRVIIKRNF